MKLEPHGVGRERPARQPRPFDRAFAFLDPLLACPALVVESNDALDRAAHVRHEEADAGIKFSGMPLDLGDNPPRLGPGSGLIAEIGMEPAHMVRRSSDWAREQIADPALQNLVARYPDREFDPLRLQPKRPPPARIRPGSPTGATLSHTSFCGGHCDRRHN